MSGAGIRWGDWVSISRIALSFVFLVLFSPQPGVSLTICIVVAALAQVSDHLDGYLVRRQGGPTLDGWLFDTVADRAFYIAAFLAFGREYGLSTIAVWLFIMREIILYAVRLVVGEFGSDYRTRAIIHATIVRLTIVAGCLAPLGISPSQLSENIPSILTALIFVSVVLGYYNLAILIRQRH